MRIIIEGNYLECDGGTFEHDDTVHLGVDTCDYDSIYLHLSGNGDKCHQHPGTIELSAEDATALAKELKKAARVSLGTLLHPATPSATTKRRA